jgi:hypothetical protein
MLALEDLKGKTKEQVKLHLETQYSGDKIHISKVKDTIEGLDILVAYESVGSWGCDSTSFFLFKDSKGELYELHGSHCSCYGFEDQFRLEKTERQALWYRMNEGRGNVFSPGGYDFDCDKNTAKVKKYIKENL